MAYRYNIDASGGAFTALTIDGACTSATAERSLNKYTGVTTNNKWDEIITDAALDNDKLRLTASTNSSSSSRSGYGKVMYKINGNTCEAILHVVQAGSGGSTGHSQYNVGFTASSLPSTWQVGTYCLYITDELISNDRDANSIKNILNGHKYCETENNYYGIGIVNVTYTGNTCAYESMDIDDICHKVSDGNWTAVSFEDEVHYYVYAIKNSDNEYHRLDMQLNFNIATRTSCSDYIEDV